MFVPLYVQELRGLARGRWVWFALAALHGFFGLLMVGPGVLPYMLDFYLTVVYLVVPSAFATFMALQIAGPRATRFVHSVFTAPVREFTYLLVKLALGLTVAGLYYLSVLPFLALYWATVGVPTHFPAFMLAGFFVVLFALAYGLLVGVVFTGRHMAAPVTVSLLPFFLLFGYMVLWEPDSDLAWMSLMIRVVHLNPQIAVMDAFGLHDWIIAESPMRSLVLLLISTTGLLLMGVWIFLRRQSVDSWKDRPGARTWVLLVALGVFLVPALAPAMGYTDEDSGSFRFSESGRVLMAAYLLEPGYELQEMSHFWMDAPIHLAVGRPMDLDLVLIFEPHGLTERFLQVQVAAQGDDGLELALADPQRPYSLTDMGIMEDAFFSLRIPTSVHATKAEGLVLAEYRVNVTLDITYRVEEEGGDEGLPPMPGGVPVQEDGSTRNETLHQSFVVAGNYPNARWLAGATGSIMPILFLVVGVVRERRRR